MREILFRGKKNQRAIGCSVIFGIIGAVRLGFIAMFFDTRSLSIPKPWGSIRDCETASAPRNTPKDR